MRVHGAGGYSLIEILVASCLLMLLMVGLHQLIRAGLYYYHTARAAETAHHEALVGLRKVTVELGESHRSSAEMGASYVIFPSATPPQNRQPRWTYRDGSLEWHKWVAYYLDGRDLMRAELDLGSPVDEPPTGSPGLGAFRNPRVVARNVLRFEAANGADPDLIEVEVTSQVFTASDRTTEVTMRSQVRPLN